MKKITELLKVYLLDKFRRPVDLFYTVLMVVGVLALSAFVINQGTTAEIIASYTVFISSYSAVWMISQSIPGDKQKGLYRMYRSSRLSKLGYVSAKLAIASLTILLSLLVVLVGYFAAPVALSGGVLLVIVLSFLAHAGFGLIVASYVKTPNEAQTIVSIILFAMIFVSPVFYTPEALPQVVQVVQKAIPLTYSIEAIRRLMVEGSSLYQVWRQVALLATLSVASISLGYRKLEY